MDRRINRAKTEFMEIAKEMEMMTVNLEETRLKQKNKFQHLSVVFNDQGIQDVYPKKRITKISRM